MATATQLNESPSPIDTLIRPANLKLVSESEGVYRCERDLHHHFTVCLNSLKSLELGTHRRRVFMERPALACYGKERGEETWTISSPAKTRVRTVIASCRAEL